MTPPIGVSAAVMPDRTMLALVPAVPANEIFAFCPGATVVTVIGVPIVAVAAMSAGGL